MIPEDREQVVDRRTFVQSAGIAVAGLGSLVSKARAQQNGQIKIGDPFRAYEVGEQTGVESLRVVTRKIPAPGSGEALIRAFTSSINARDFGIISGLFFGRKPEERIPLAEGAGQVVAVGNGVKGVAPGDRVTVNHLPDWDDGPWHPRYYEQDIGNSLDGWLAEYVLMPASALVKLPDSISYEAAATFASSGITAWQGLFEVGGVKAGDIVLTLGTGGVSTFGLLFSKAVGATVVMTSSSDEKLEKMRGLGADITINYRKNPNWAEEVYEKTNGHGADIILENVGRSNIDNSMPAAAASGKIVLIGTGPIPEKGPVMRDLFMRNLTLRAISVGSTHMFEDMVAFIADKNIQPVIDRTFAFEDAQAAFTYMRDPKRIGKVVIRHA